MSRNYIFFNFVATLKKYSRKEVEKAIFITAFVYFDVGVTP